MLANDTGAATLSAVDPSKPANGTLTLNPDGSFVYVPNPGFAGTDSFSYQANDGATNSNPATVTITVNNSTPVAVNDGYSHDDTAVYLPSRPRWVC